MYIRNVCFMSFKDTFRASFKHNMSGELHRLIRPKTSLHLQPRGVVCQTTSGNQIHDLVISCKQADYSAVAAQKIRQNLIYTKNLDASSHSSSNRFLQGSVQPCMAAELRPG